MDTETSLITQNNLGDELSVRFINRNFYSPLEVNVEDDSAIEYPYRCYVNSTDCVVKTRISDILEWSQFNRQISTGFTWSIIWFALDKVDFLPPTLFKPLGTSIDFFASKIEEIIVSYEQLPVSYNQIMIRGALRYCARLLNKIFDDSDKYLLDKVKSFIILVKNLRTQTEASTTFTQLDLTYIENTFESIEEEAFKKGYLPKLEEMPV